MPELPEVETVRRGLAELLTGRVIERVEVLDERLVRPRTPAQVEAMLRGARVSEVTRRGKYLLLNLQAGRGALVALQHLRMTGSFAGPGQPVPAHERMRWYIANGGGVLRYNDPRRFGTLELGDPADITSFLDARLGPEPFDESWGAGALLARTRGRSAPLKAVLLDQRTVAGLGNIYVDEACFLAGVRPDRPADRLTRSGAERLVDAIRARLDEAIRVGGSTLRDYRGVAGEVGGMQERFVAYGRAGLPCLVCGTTMRGGRVAGRSTTWCTTCQPAR